MLISTILQHPLRVLISTVLQHPLRVLKSTILQHPLRVLISKILLYPLRVLISTVPQYPLRVLINTILQHPLRVLISTVHQHWYVSTVLQHPLRVLLSTVLQHPLRVLTSTVPSHPLRAYPWFKCMYIVGPGCPRVAVRSVREVVEVYVHLGAVILTFSINMENTYRTNMDAKLKSKTQWTQLIFLPFCVTTFRKLRSWVSQNGSKRENMPFINMSRFIFCNHPRGCIIKL